MLTTVWKITDDQAQRVERSVVANVRNEHLFDSHEVKLARMNREAVRSGTIGHDDRFAIGLAVAVFVA
jgi:hypothetical protein